MPYLARSIFVLTPILLWAGLSVFPLSEAAAPPAPELIPARPDSFRAPKAEFVGATSCAAASCHGGPAGRLGGEYATWSGQSPDGEHARDPHSRAFRVLFNNVSQNIVRNLAAVSQKAPATPAHEMDLCLKCHSTTSPFASQDAPAKLLPRHLPDASVGCESCHGPAEHYLAEHYLPGFQALSGKEKAEQYGLYPTKDLSSRVKACAKCHVGDADREVNHDLIAAGHPRLMFEYTSYHHHPAYQNHWTEKSYGDDFDVRAWLIGEVATARASVALLQARAERAERNERHVPWPEFTEYSCYACHQDLGVSGAGWKAVNASKHRNGAMPWGTWTMPALGAIERMGGDLNKGATAALESLHELRRLMEDPTSSPGRIKSQCEDVIGKLDPWLAALQQIPTSKPIGNLEGLYRVVVNHALTDDQKFNDLDWDGAAQHYLALAALYYSAGLKNPDLEEAMRKLRSSLLFPAKYNSPHDEKAVEVLKQFQQLRKLTQEGKP